MLYLQFVGLLVLTFSAIARSSGILDLICQHHSKYLSKKTADYSKPKNYPVLELPHLKLPHINGLIEFLKCKSHDASNKEYKHKSDKSVELKNKYYRKLQNERKALHTKNRTYKPYIYKIRDSIPQSNNNHPESVYHHTPYGHHYNNPASSGNHAANANSLPGNVISSGNSGLDYPYQHSGDSVNTASGSFIPIDNFGTDHFYEHRNSDVAPDPNNSDCDYDYDDVQESVMPNKTPDFEDSLQYFHSKSEMENHKLNDRNSHSDTAIADTNHFYQHRNSHANAAPENYILGDNTGLDHSYQQTSDVATGPGSVIPNGDTNRFYKHRSSHDDAAPENYILGDNTNLDNSNTTYHNLNVPFNGNGHSDTTYHNLDVPFNGNGHFDATYHNLNRSFNGSGHSNTTHHKFDVPNNFHDFTKNDTRNKTSPSDIANNHLALYGIATLNDWFKSSNKKYNNSISFKNCQQMGIPQLIFRCETLKPKT